MHITYRHAAYCLVFTVLHWIVPGTSYGQPPKEVQAGEQSEHSHQILTTPDGVRFGVFGNRNSSPAPTVFLFGSLLDESLAGDHCRIVRKCGCMCVALDAPGHGLDRDAGEPPELRSWRHRLEAEMDFVAAFNRKVSSVLDYLVAERDADPKRVVAIGGLTFPP